MDEIIQVNLNKEELSLIYLACAQYKNRLDNLNNEADIGDSKEVVEYVKNGLDSINTKLGLLLITNTPQKSKIPKPTW